MKFPPRGSILLAACTLAAWPSCSTDTTGLEWTDMGGSGGGASASGGRTGNGTGGHDISGTGSAPASGGAYASGGDSGTGGDTSGSGGSDTGTGGNADTGGAIGTGGEGIGGRAGTGGAASGGRVGTGGAATGGRGTGGAATGGHGTGGAATGGAGTGGRGTGGASTGGAGTGGMPGSGGAMGTGGAVVGKPECVTAADCRLENDCCACRAVPTSAPPSACLLLCLQTKCAQQGLPPGRIDCVAGRCVAGFTCETSTVVCDQATPACPAGSVPSLSANGNCFSGNCVLATQCLSVDSCGSCGDGNQACVTERPKDGDTSRHCVTIPPVCQGAATCGCFGPSTCVSPNTSCTNSAGANGVSCSHP